MELNYSCKLSWWAKLHLPFRYLWGSFTLSWKQNRAFICSWFESSCVLLRVHWNSSLTLSSSFFTCLFSTISHHRSYFPFGIRAPSRSLNFLLAPSLPLSWFPHVSFSYSSLSRLLTSLLCSVSSIPPSCLAFCTCYSHYQPPVMHIYCLASSSMCGMCE